MTNQGMKCHLIICSMVGKEVDEVFLFSCFFLMLLGGEDDVACAILSAVLGTSAALDAEKTPRGRTPASDGGPAVKGNAVKK